MPVWSHGTEDAFYAKGLPKPLLSSHSVRKTPVRQSYIKTKFGVKIYAQSTKQQTQDHGCKEDHRSNYLIRQTRILKPSDTQTRTCLVPSLSHIHTPRLLICHRLICIRQLIGVISISTKDLHSTLIPGHILTKFIGISVGSLYVSIRRGRGEDITNPCIWHMRIYDAFQSRTAGSYSACDGHAKSSALKTRVGAVWRFWESLCTGNQG